MIDCFMCGATVPRDTTTYTERHPEVSCCCACLAYLNTKDSVYGPGLSMDAAWRWLMESEAVPTVAVPIDSATIPMDAVITFHPYGAA